MRDATKDEELKVVKTMIALRLRRQNIVATDDELTSMAEKIIKESDEKIGVLELPKV